MKKRWVLLLMLLWASVPAWAEGCAITEYMGGACAQQGCEVWTLDENAVPQQKIHTFAQPPADIFGHEDVLYAAFLQDDGVRFAALENGVENDCFAVTGEGDLRDFAVAGDCLFALWDDALSGGYRLCAYSLTGEPRPAPRNVAAAIAADGPDSLLLATADAFGSAILSWNVRTGEEIVLVDCVDRVDALAGTSQRLYYAGYGSLNQLQDGKISTVCMFDSGATPALATLGDAVVGYDPAKDGAQAVLFVYAPAEQAETVLTFVNMDAGLLDDRMNAALAILAQEYPHVRAEFIDMLPEQLNTALMARDDSLDILNVNWANAGAVIASGALLDLHGHAGIVENLKQWNHVEPLATHDGMLYGVPSVLWATTMTANEALAGYAPDGLQAVNVDWRQLLQAVLEFDGDVNGDGRQDMWLFADSYAPRPAWLEQYVAASGDLRALRFDTPLFRELAELYRACVQADRLIDTWDTRFAWDNALYYMELSAGPFRANMAPPLLDGEQVVVSATKAMGVNAAGADKEIALRFLEIYTGVDVQLARNEGYLAAEISLNTDDRKRAGAQEMAQMRAMMDVYANLSPDLITQDFQTYVLGDRFERYCAGEMTTDELIRQMDGALKMLLMG